jgi:translation initiation factor 2-alpha kinase 4
LYARELLKAQLTAVFRKAGAVDFDTPLLSPGGRAHNYEPLAMRLLDPTGCVVELPGDLTQAFARLVARTSTTDIRRYHFGREFVTGALGYQPVVSGDLVQKKC